MISPGFLQLWSSSQRPLTSQNDPFDNHVDDCFKYCLIDKLRLILCSLSVPCEGPFKIIKHNDNGSITIKHAPYKEENISRQHVHPYYRKHTNDESQQNDNNKIFEIITNDRVQLRLDRMSMTYLLDCEIN